MFSGMVKKFVWIGCAMGLLLSSASYADFLFQGGQHKKQYNQRYNRSGFQRQFHRNNNRHQRHQRYQRNQNRRVYRNHYRRPATSGRRHDRRFNRQFNRSGYGYQQPNRRRTCQSVDSAIWAAQRRYAGGRVISARARNGYIEVRILYRGRVAVVRERCR